MNRAFRLFPAITLWIVLMSISVTAQQPDDPRHFSKFHIPFFQDRMLVDNPQNDLDHIYNKYETCLYTREPRGEDETWLFDYDQKKRITKFTRVSMGSKLVEKTAYKEDVKGRLIEMLVTSYNHDMTVSEVKKSTFTYNVAGDIIAWSTPEGQNTTSYDAQHRIISSSHQENFDGKAYSRKLSYVYDEKGRIIETKAFSNYFNHLETVVYTDMIKDGIRTEAAVVTTRDLDPATGKLTVKAPKIDSYKSVYNDQNDLLESHHLGHFSIYLFYDNRRMVIKQIRNSKGEGSTPSVTQFTYNGKGRLMSRVQNEMLNFKSIKDYKLGKVTEEQRYNYQTGKMVRSGESVGETLINDIRCFDAEATAPAVNAAQATSAMESGLKLLFKDITSNLTAVQQQQIFSKSGFSVSADGKQLMRTGFADTAVIAKNYFFSMGSSQENLIISYAFRNAQGVTEKKILFFAYQTKGPSSATEFQKLYDGPGVLPQFTSDRTFYIARAKLPPVPFMYFGTTWEQMVPKVVSQSGRHIGIDFEEYITLSKGSRENLAKRFTELRGAQQDFVSNKRDQAEKELEQKTAQGKGKSAKFLGKYWQLGEYKTVYTLSKVGTNFILTSNGKPLLKSSPKFIFNAKADQLEAWVNDGKIKYKVRIYYDYRNNSIYVGPEDRRFGWSINLLVYK